MPEVAFHTGRADKIGYTCRLLRKACRQGFRVRVVAEPAELELLDKALWTFDAHDFVPHVRLPAGATPSQALARTPIWLTHDASAWPEGTAAAQVLVNLGLPPSEECFTYERVVEIVSDDPAELAAGRQRWRLYTARGFAAVHLPATAEP
jgi:DNA polymerase III subunit chi